MTSTYFTNTSRALAAILTVGAAVVVFAQDADDAEDAGETIDEIIVIGGQKPGDKIDLDALYEQEMRERLMRDLESLKEEQEKGRWSTPDTGVVQTAPRMSWGYDPEASAKMRRETDFPDESFETVKPASLFRVEF